MTRTTSAVATLALAIFATAATPFPVTLHAQTLDDAIFMGRRVVCLGVLATRDSWSTYYEGTLKRGNDNLGTVTTQQLVYMGAYGLTERLTLMATVPYVATKASAGVLQGQSGIQDFTVAGKLKVLSTPLTSVGTLNVIAVGGYGAPVSAYTPDFQPLSIGMASKRAIGRGTLQFMSHKGWYVNGSAGYTWRSNVKLARPAYYADNQLVLSDEVRMPDVVDYVAAVGYESHGVNLLLPYSTQRTLGGGDIRRQDMPFVSNRMNFSKVGAKVEYTIPRFSAAHVWASASRVLDGRNVGLSTGYMVGLVFAGRP